MMNKKMKAKNTNYRFLGIVALLVMIAASVQVSYALNAGSPTPVPAAEVIPDGTLAPSNYLQVVDGMKNTNVEILDMGSGVKQTAVLDNTTTAKDGALYGGNWSLASTQRISHYDGYEALAIQFIGSDITAANYSTDEDAGWNANDLSLDTTTMWIKIKYFNVGYYKGEPIDAVATIKVTPYKNRTSGASYANLNYSNKVYYPTIQLSELLHNGWCWQNVGEFNVDLAFYKKGNPAAIEFPSTSFSDTSGVYYTLNSLNPAKTFYEKDVTTLTGPEYVWPKSGTTSHAYIVDNSNIKLSYEGDTDAGSQHGYNGGTNKWGAPWDESQDDPASPDWNLNSTMFTTSNTSHLNFTLGLMGRDPYDENHVKRTNYMWASFSTDSFSGKTVTYIDIPVSKVWVDSDTSHPDSVTVDLYQEWTDTDWSDTASIHSEKVQTVVLDDSNDWRDSFKYLPAKADLAEKLGLSQDQVRYTAKEVEVPGYIAAYPNQDDGSIVVENKKVKPVTTASIDVQKIVKGNPSKDEIFTFELTPDKDTFPMPEGSNGKQDITIKGSGTGSFDTWAYTKPGVYTYQVKEVAGSNENYTYDNTAYIITDTVTLNDSGDLEVSRTAVDGALSFINEYTPKEPATPDKPTPTTPDNADNPDNISPVKTGDTASTFQLFLLSLVSLAGIATIGAYVSVSKRKIRKQS